jgi:hypothetical protein
VDCEWDHKEEQLGSPEKAGARKRAVELMANGWQIETVLFRTGRWTFRRPRPADIAPSAPVAPMRD